MPILVLAEDSFLIKTSITLTGKELEKDEFKFVLKNQNGEVIQTKKNDADGKVVFDKISYDSLELNQTDNYFLYTIEEVDEKKLGYTYDKYKAYVKVYIKKENDDTYSSIVTYYKDKDYKEELKNIPKYTQKPYHATAEELEKTSYARYDYNTKTLTFFREDPDNMNLTHGDYGYATENGHSIIYLKDAEKYPYTWKYYYIDGVVINNDCKHIIIEDAFKPEKNEELFRGFKELLDIDLAKLDTSNFTNMNFMFAYLPKLEKLDLTTLDFSNVTSMNNMFDQDSSLTELRIGSDADMSKVRDYTVMFRGTTNLEIMDMSWLKITGNDYVQLLHMFQDSSLKYLDMNHWNFKYVRNNQPFSSTFQNLDNLEYADFSNLTTDVCGAYTSNDFVFEQSVRTIILSKEFNNIYSMIRAHSDPDIYWYNVDENVLTDELFKGSNGIGTCNYLMGGRYINIADTYASFVSSYREVSKEDKTNPSKDNKKSSSKLPGEIEKHIINPETNDVFALVVTALALSGIIYVVVLKKKKSKLFLVLLIGILSISLTGCKDKKNFDGDIVSFRYSEGSGMGPSYEYEINLEKNKYIFKAGGYNGANLDVEKEISEEQVKKLSKIINDNDIKSWDGFDKSDKDVMDGHSFSLFVNYKSGEKIEAHGYMKYPSNYREASKELEDYLLLLAKEE
jgi:surface protein